MNTIEEYFLVQKMNIGEKKDGKKFKSIKGWLK